MKKVRKGCIIGINTAEDINQLILKLNNQYDCDFNGCKNGLHPFKVITSFEFGDEAKVVRWCPECGAVVVDMDYDNRTNAGYYRKLEYPNITKKYGLEK